MDILRYKDYEGTAELDMARGVCRGKILFIDDVVTYEAKSPTDLQKQFEEAVDDYLETCKSLNRNPQKPLRGQFNVRIAPELHKAATLRAISDNKPLNEIVVRALESFLCPQQEVNHKVTVKFDIQESTLKTIAASASAQPQWETINNVRH
jgi:predicted HicB family RNase H-like nuclease